jgi:hypothetical protein
LRRARTGIAAVKWDQALPLAEADREASNVILDIPPVLCIEYDIAKVTCAVIVIDYITRIRDREAACPDAVRRGAAGQEIGCSGTRFRLTEASEEAGSERELIERHPVRRDAVPSGDDYIPARA